MMKRILILISLMPLLLYGCIVQSLTPFYTGGSIVEMDGLNGSWRLVRERGKDVSGRGMKPWVIKDHTVLTFDENGVPAKLRIVFFWADDALFVDVTEYYPDESRLNRLWYYHSVPVHSVCRVRVLNDRLIIIPLNKSWMEEAVKDGRFSMPSFKLEDSRLQVYYPSPGEWFKFLKEHADDKGAFPEEGRYELVRIAGRPEMDAHEDDIFPPYDLVAGNVEKTDVTVAVEITATEEAEVLRSDDGKTGYILYSIKGRVLKSYRGDIEAGGGVVYYCRTEAGLSPPSRGGKYIVSLRRDGDRLLVPGEGYQFEFTDRLDGLYERASATGKGHEGGD